MKIKKLTYLLFVISNFLILFNPGIFWDDWTLFNMPSEAIYSQFTNAGIGYFGPLHVFLQSFPNPPLIYHILTFGLQLTSIYYLFKIVKKQKYQEGNYFVLIYAVLPLYDAKITMICFPYSFTLTLFIIATFFLLKYKYEKRTILRILSLVLYFISFTTGSLVFFYLVPFLLIIFLNEIQLLIKGKFKSLNNLFFLFIKKLIKFSDFLLLPFIFWLFKILFFSPRNHYENYNTIKLESFVNIPYRLIKSIYSFFLSLNPIFKDLIQHFEFTFLFIFISLLIFRGIHRADLNFKPTITKFLIGLIICFIGIFPYLLVNKFPDFINYSSRHQLLLGFGISIIFTNLIFCISSDKLKKIVLSLSLGLFVILNIFIQFSYFKGFMKEVVLNNFLETKDLKGNYSKTILFRDSTRDFTLKGNPSKFYELSGILKLSHSEENIMLIEKNKFISTIQKDKFKKLVPYFSNYNLSKYELVEPSIELQISYSKKSRPPFPLISYYRDFFNGNSYLWNKYFSFNLRPLNEEIQANYFKLLQD